MLERFLRRRSPQPEEVEVVPPPAILPAGGSANLNGAISSGNANYGITERPDLVGDPYAVTSTVGASQEDMGISVAVTGHAFYPQAADPRSLGIDSRPTYEQIVVNTSGPGFEGSAQVVSGIRPQAKEAPDAPRRGIMGLLPRFRR